MDVGQGRIRRVRVRKLACSCCGLLIFATNLGLAWGQVGSDTRSADQPRQRQSDDIVVIGRRLGSADGAPERELDAKAIDSFSADTIGEFLERFAPFLDGSGDEPSLLVNGKRITNRAEIAGFPPEALERVEVLPVDAALRYGEAPGKRMVNLVVRKQFKMTVASTQTTVPTAGGRIANSLGLQNSRIADDTRFGVDGRLSFESPLLASERGLENEADPQGLRTMLPKARDVGLNVTFARPIAGFEFSGALSGNVGKREQIDASLNPSMQTVKGGRLSLGLSGNLLGWAANVGLDTQVNWSDVRSGARLSADSFLDRSIVGSGSVRAEVSRSTPFSAAGPAQISASGSLSLEWFRNSGGVSQMTEEGAVSTKQWATQISLALPIAKRAPGDERLNAFGDIALTARIGATGASSAKALLSFDTAVNWRPVSKIQLVGQFGLTAIQPGADQLSGPIVETTNFPIYDFVVDRSVGVVRVTGGNGALKSGSRRSSILSLNAGPFGPMGLSPSIVYESSSSSGAVGKFPWFSPAVEAAYPERVTRDASGNLVRIDARPINLDRDRDASLRTSLRFSIPIRWLFNLPSSIEPVQVSFSRAWHLTSQTEFKPGITQFDRLKGDAGGVSTGGASLTLEGRIGPVSISMAGRWRRLSRIRMNVGADGPDDLIFDESATADIRLSYSIGDRRQDQKARSIFWGLRPNLEVENVFGSYSKAHLGSGAQATGYRRYDQDALGRIVRFSLSRPI